MGQHLAGQHTAIITRRVGMVSAVRPACAGANKRVAAVQCGACMRPAPPSSLKVKARSKHAGLAAAGRPSSSSPGNTGGHSPVTHACAQGATSAHASAGTAGMYMLPAGRLFPAAATPPPSHCVGAARCSLGAAPPGSVLLHPRRCGVGQGSRAPLAVVLRVRVRGHLHALTGRLA